MGGVAQAMQPNNPVTPSQDNVQDPVRVDQVPPTLQSTEGRKTNASGSTGALYCTCRGPYTGEFMISCDKCSEWYHGRCVGISPQEAEEWENQDYICSGCKIKPDPPHKRQMSSDEGSSGGSPKRSWAAEEKKEQREVSPRGRHHDRVPSVERVVPSQGDAKGALQGPLSRWLGTPLWAFQPTGMLTARLHWVGVFRGERRPPRKEEEKESAERAPSRRDSQAAEGTKGGPTEADTKLVPGRGKKGHPNITTRPLGQGCQDRGHPRSITHRERLGCRVI
ncbi:nucleosome-remodeling factor subunit BPTF [Mytilus galloprovincialis]|uniref:Nucleosome-remodeling factor subunit BPTF n=1 Tax=Mytilus galloprovincialis TaxID=29158 RepID=A0A8B6DQN6_MYTGA|nr:nucleosome-remodeling factor subunit BPTF [Mytilus galloprovincialis]